MQIMTMTRVSTCMRTLAAAAACAALGIGISCAFTATDAQAAVQKVPAGATYAFDGDCGACHTTEAASYAAADADAANPASANADVADTTAADAEKTADSKKAAAADDTADAGEKDTATSKSADPADPADAPAAPCQLLLQVSFHQAFDCTACHDDQQAMDDVHEGVAEGDRIPKRLKKTTVDDQVCLTCHESYDALAEMTADCTALTDANGTTVNPHEVADMNEKHQSLFTCFSCHEAHGGDPVSDAASRTCESCHHVNVYECFTCHD